MLFLSSLILIGGALGDRYGRRRLFISGIWIFALSSIACATAHAAELSDRRTLHPRHRRRADDSREPRTHYRGLRRALARPRHRHLGGGLGNHDGRRSGARRMAHAGVLLALGLLDKYSACRRRLVAGSSARSRKPRRRRSGKPDLLGSAPHHRGARTHRRGADADAAPARKRGLASACNRRVLRSSPHSSSSSIAAPRRSCRCASLRRADSGSRTSYAFLLYAAIGGELFFVPFELQHIMLYTPLATGLALLPTIALIADGFPDFRNALRRALASDCRWLRERQ